MKVGHRCTPLLCLNESRADENPKRRINLPAWFLILGIISPAVISFILGCAVRLHLLGRIDRNINNGGAIKGNDDSELDRVLFQLDDAVQRNNLLYKNFLHHYETLVHPAMVSHLNPRRVTIVARGNKGVLLHEVLKHKTVVKVVQLDVGRDILNEWSNCSDLAESEVDSFFDDPRARSQFANALEWFIRQFAIMNGDSKEENTQDSIYHGELQELFDVVIMDIDQLRLDSLFIQSLYNSLNINGVYAVRLGNSPRGSDLVDKAGMFKKMLEDAGFESMHVYEDVSILYLISQ